MSRRGIDFSRRAQQNYRDRMEYDSRWKGLYLGEIESTEDPNRIGRILVHVPELNSTTEQLPGDRKSDPTAGFIWCHPVFPFFGSSDFIEKNDADTYDGFSRAYGIWGPMPDKGDLVVISFINDGTPVWLGCYPRARKNFMVPGVAGDEVEGETYFLPATEKSITGSGLRKAVKTLSDNIKLAGLANDNNRGPGTSSSQREMGTSLVTGIKSRGTALNVGGSIVIDDHSDQQAIRLRTGHGHQITISDVTKSIYVSTSKGNLG